MTEQVVTAIGPYLVPGAGLVVEKVAKPINDLPDMLRGSSAYDDGFLLLTKGQADAAMATSEVPAHFFRKFIGSTELINGKPKMCLWITDSTFLEAAEIPWLAERFEQVRDFRTASARANTSSLAGVPCRFGEVRDVPHETVLVIPRVSSENRPFLPIAVLGQDAIIGDRNFALYDAPIWNMALIASRLHWVWIGMVCVRMRTDFSYSNTLGWNTFPVPPFTEQNKADLTRCAEDILLAREAHFPATIADLYDPERMPYNLRAAHDRNDETLERIYIGRRFRNDTERLETLFAMYAKMTEKQSSGNRDQVPGKAKGNSVTAKRRTRAAQ